MADIKELRETPGALYLYSGDFQGVVTVFSAMLVTDTNEPDYIIVAADQGQPRKLSIEGELEEKGGTYFFKANGKNYALSDFSESHAETLFGGLLLTKELAEMYVTTGLKTSVGVEDGRPVGVYLTSSDGKIYAREDAAWVEKDELPDSQEIVEVGNTSAAMVSRGLDVGVDVTLQEANIKLNNQ
jgi:hypothetical protein